MILKIVQHPDKRLKMPSTPLTAVTDATRALASNLSRLMMEKGAIWIAAPQLGIMKKLCVVFDGRFGLVALANPVITEHEGAIMLMEQSLSFPSGKGAVVYRPTKLKVKYRTIEDKEVELEFDGQAACAISAAVDCLNGITLLDRNKQAQTLFKKQVEMEKESKEKENEIRSDVKEAGSGSEPAVFNDWGDGLSASGIAQS